MTNQTSNPQLNPDILAIVRGLAMTENGGKIPNQKTEKAGQSGETKSVWQFMPDTWSSYAGQVLGNKKAPITPENEAAVVYGKVQSWYNEDIKDGYTPQQIIERAASRWNAGEQNPDAYKQNYKGTNKEGINYNTPKYASSVLKYAKQAGEQSAIGTSQTQPPTVATAQPTGNPGMMPPFTLKTPNQKSGSQKGMINEMA